MAKRHVLPDGNAVLVPDDMSWSTADDWAQHQYPESYGVTQKHGFLEAAKSGLKEGVGAGLKGIGSLAGSENLQNAVTAMMTPGTEAGAYRPTTEADTSAAYKKGIAPGLYSSYNQYVGENLGNMVGRYGIPTAVGAGAAMLAPEFAVAGIGAGALGTIAADAPMELGENIQRNEERAKQGFQVPKAGSVGQVMSSLAQAALLPLAGSLGQKLVTPFMKTMGPSLAETAQKVAAGQMTKDEAVAQLNGIGKNVLLRTGEAGVVGPTLMTGTEALRTAQSGEDVSSPEATARLKESAEAGLSLAPLGALGGLGMRRGQVKEMGRAADQFGKTYAEAGQQNAAVDEQNRKNTAWQAQQNAAVDEQNRKNTAWQAQQGEQTDLGLPEPKQPKGGRAAYEATVAETAEPTATIPVGYFNKLGLPNNKATKELRAKYEGAPLTDTDSIAALRDDLADISNPETAPDWLTKHKKADKIAASLQAASAELDQKIQGQHKMLKQQGDMFAAAPDQGHMQDMFSGIRAPVDMSREEPAPAKTGTEFDDQNAALHEQFQKAHDHYQTTGDDTALKEVLATAKEQLGPFQEAQNAASTQELFKAPVAKPSMEDLAGLYGTGIEKRHGDRASVSQLAGLKDEHNLSIPTGNHTAEAAPAPAPAPHKVVVKSKGEFNFAKDMTDETKALTRLARHKGYENVDDFATNHPDEFKATTEKWRAEHPLEGAPKAVEKATLTTQQQVDALALENRTVKNQAKMRKLLAQRAAEQQAMAKNKGVGALTLPAEPTPAAPKRSIPRVETATANKAAREWEHGRGEDKAYPKYAALHPDAKSLLHARMDMHEKGLTGKDFKDVAQAHRAAERSDRIHKEVAEELAPRATGKKNQAQHTKEQAEVMVKNITDKWSNAPQVDVKNFDELNPEEQHWAHENKAAGFINKDGGITIISDRHVDLHDVKATLFHESLGHYGLRNKFGKDLQQMLKGMYDTHPGLKRAADDVRAVNLKLTPEQAVEEVLAERQVGTSLHQNLTSRIVALVRQYMRKMGVVHQFTKNDIVAILRQARSAVETGPKAEVVVGEQAARAQVISRDEVPKSFEDRMREMTDSKGRNFTDRMANALLGNASSVMSKLGRAGESGAWSNLLKGRVSAEFAHWQGTNAMTVVSSAMASGHMVIEKTGFVHAVDDTTHNFKALVKQGHNIRDKLESLGYKEKGDTPDDPNTITNAMALALFGPRLEALVKNGQFIKEAYNDESKAMSDTLRAHPDLKPLLHEFQATYNVLRGHAIDALVDSGIKTEKEAKEFMDRGEYLPLYRMDDELQNTLGEPTHVNSLLRAAAEHHLGEGNERSIGDPVTNAFNNLTWLNTRAVKNNTAKILMESLIAEGSAHRQRFQGNAKDPTIIKFNVDGEPAFFRLDDVNDASAFTAAPVMTGFGWKIARDFTNVLRKGVTMMPGFVWGQASQDSQRVAIRTGQSYWKSYKDVASSTINEMRGPEHETQTQKELRAAGIVAARDFVDGTESFRKEMLDKPDSVWHKTIEKLERMAAASDGASREAAYNAVMAKTGDKLQALHAARQLIDFNNRGNSRTLAALMTVVPFVNARIQGTHRMVDALRGKIPGMSKEDAQKMAAMQVGKMVAFTLAYTLYNQGSEEYENETAQGRNNNFMFPGGLKMPVASELLPFKVMAEVAARQMLSDPHEDYAKSRDAIANSVGTMFMGPQDMVPIIGKPFLEQITNHSFSTGHELIGQSLQGKSASQQFNQSTTGFAKALSEGTEGVASMMGMHYGAGISPIVLENYLTGFTGRIGQEMLNFYRGLESAAGTRAAPKISELPLVGSMFMNPEGNAMRSDFQDVSNAVSTAQADLKALRDQGNFKEAATYQKEHQPLLSLQGRLTPIQQQLTAINKQLKTGEPSAAKRDALYRRQLQVLDQVMELRKQAAPWL